MTSKRALLYGILTVVMLCVTIAAAEIGSLLALYVRNGRWISGSEMRTSLGPAETVPDSEQTLVARDRNLPWMRYHVLHPYVGFVLDGGPGGSRFLSGREVPINDLGFIGELPAQDGPGDRWIVVLTGGSVAKDLFLKSAERLADELSTKAGFEGKRIEVISMATGGMKQPQQLMALSYYLSLGYPADVVVNLDGFNEIVLPFSENLPLQVHPSFPRNWSLYASKAVDLEAAVLVGRQAEIRRRMEHRRARLSRSPLRHSRFSLALWHGWNTRRENELKLLDAELRERLARRTAVGAQETGPPYSAATETDVFVDSVDLWKRASLLMWGICKAAKIEYLHLLQPNQYVAGSKPMTNREQRLAIGEPDYLYRRCAEQAYPQLITAGHELVGQGLPFVDLTGLFSDETGVIYRDECCHYNQRGNDLLAARLAELIADLGPDAAETTPPPPPTGGPPSRR
jgi:hypothetical protein